MRRKEQLASSLAVAEPMPDRPAPSKPAADSKPAPASTGITIVLEGGPDDAEADRAASAASQKGQRRLNPIKQKQMEDRRTFLEEEIPRIESSIAHTEEQLGVFVSAAETQRLTDLAASLRGQLASLTSEWEELTLQLESA